jgi:PAS domain S-box-containing protein
MGKSAQQLETADPQLLADRFRQFFSSLPEYCYIVSPSGEILDVNPAACEALGYPKDELVGKPISALYAPECHEKMSALFSRWKQTGQLRNEEMTILTRDGRRRTVLLYAAAVKDAEGTILSSASVQVDITELKAAQMAQFHHAAIVSSSEDAIISKDLDGIICSWNAAAERMFGYRAEEVLGRPVTHLIPPELQAEEEEILRRMRAGERVAHGETIRLTKSGRKIHVSLSVSPVRNAEGVVIGASKIVRDISDRMLAEQGLRASEERFRSVANTAPVLIWMSGADQKLVYFNEPWFSFTGRTMEQESGDGWSQGIHPADRDRYAKVYARSFAAREKFGIEYRLRRYDGQYRWFHGMAVPRFDPEGGFLGYIGTCTDVTEREEIEQRLRISEELSRAVVRNSPVAMVVSHGKEQRQELMNPKFTELFGYTIGDMCSIEQWWLLAYPDAAYRAEVMAKWQAIVDQVVGEHKDAGPMEARVRCKDGSVRDIEFHMALLADVTDAHLVSFIDLTDQKRAEAQRTQMLAEIAHLNRAASLGQMVASLAHELGQPLAAILSNAEAAERFASRDELNLEEIRSALAEIKEDDLRAKAVVQNLRSMFRKEHIARQEIDLNPLIRDVVRLVRHEAQRRAVAFHLNLAPCPVKALGDRVVLQQVMLNLIGNAMDAMEATPKDRRVLTLTTELQSENFRASILVEDNGPGIPEEQRQRLFTPFFTTKREGLGLGLSICRSLIESLGGRIELQDREAPGAAFYIQLPLAPSGN